MVAIYTHLDPITLFSSYFAQCILLQQSKQLKTLFLILPPNVYPIFPNRSIVKLPQRDISRLQLPITLGFALTKYKVQSGIFNSSIVDLKCRFRGGTALYRRFCSTYVELLQLCSFAGLGLLQPINITDIDNQPYLQLYDKDLRLDNINRTTSDEKEIKARRL